jgi:hypothetical protein
MSTPSVSNGAFSPTALSILQNNFSPALVGSNWTALLTAIATGDDYVTQTNEAIFDQAFLATADYPYLVDRASDVGLIYPQNLGITDDNFRKFALTVTAAKITKNSLLSILEVFYGDALTRASITSTTYQPYALYGQNQPQLSFLIDGVPVTVVFFISDFTVNGAATAEDLAQAINRYFTWNGITAFAGSYYNPIDQNTYLTVYSGSLGVAGSIACTGGSAQDVILFPNILTTLADSTTTWNVAYSPTISGNARYSYDTGTNPNVWNTARVGDYVNIFAPFGYTSAFNVNNQGNFQIVDVGVNYFEVYNPRMVAQTAVAATPLSDIVNQINFYQPEKFTIFSNPVYATIELSQKEVLNAYLPAASPIVARTIPTGSYFQIPTQGLIAWVPGVALGITTVTISASGTLATLTADAATIIGMATGQYVFLSSQPNSSPLNPLGDGLYGPLTAVGTSTFAFAYSGALTDGSYSANCVSTLCNFGRDSSGNIWAALLNDVSGFNVGDWVYVEDVYPNVGQTITGYSAATYSTPSSGRVNLTYQVTSVNSTTNIIKLATLNTNEMVSSQGGIITNYAAPLGVGIPGPYMYDTNIDNANVSSTITNIQTTVLQQLNKGFSYTNISVTDPSKFPNIPGYLVFNYGSDNQVNLVPYVGSFTNSDGDGGFLTLLPGYVFPLDVPINSVLIYSGTAPGVFVPTLPIPLNTAYLTDSPAGRAAAEDALLQCAAAGFENNINIIWPTIFGVGNWAYPVKLNQPALGGGGKINDIVRIWAEDITEDVNNAINFDAPLPIGETP